MKLLAHGAATDESRCRKSNCWFTFTVTSLCASSYVLLPNERVHQKARYTIIVVINVYNKLPAFY